MEGKTMDKIDEKIKIIRDDFHDRYSFTVEEVSRLDAALQQFEDSLRMREVVKAQGYTLIGKEGQVVAHPLIPKIKAGQELYLKFVKSLGIKSD
jgi:hypothetical protein